MEAAPPSYETAILADHWDITARYMLSRDLCAAALVCSRWHATFVPHLWGSPASHFGIGNDAVYVALTRFKRTLKTARLFVRTLTHTLHLPPAHAELYDGPHADWLRDILESLPNLQSLIVRGLPFFDYAALRALRHPKKDSGVGQPVIAGVVELPGSDGLAFRRALTSIPSFGLRLLDASRCPNVTSHGLAQALSQFEALMYLDLSFTYPARDSRVLDTMKIFTGLQVLKMRGIGLGDDAIECLSKSIGLRVRSLDIRDNSVSDLGVRSLLDSCFLNVRSRPSQPDPGPPSLLPYLGSEMLGIYQGENFEGFLRDAFTGKFISRLAIEDAPDSGITHLYIAGNQVSVEGISGLLRSEQLHVLDVGDIKPKLVIPGSPTVSETRDPIQTPGVEKLTPVFSRHAGQMLTFLRINHSLITKDTPSSSRDEIVPGRVELCDTSLPYRPPAVEIGGSSIRPESFEVAAEAPSPRYELAASQVQFKAREEFNSAEDEAASQPRRGSIYAPEVVPPATLEIHSSTPFRPSCDHEGATEGGPSPNAYSATSSGILPLPSTGQMLRSYSSMALERKSRLNAHTMSRHGLHPGMIPHVTTLVLTDIPVSTTDGSIADRLILFIKQCAEEATFAHHRALLDYSLPPGRMGHIMALKHSERKSFALQRVVLELAPKPKSRQTPNASLWRHQETRSMTEDRDSEALWAASETDFSFFGDEECGLPSSEPGGSSLHFNTAEKEVHNVDSSTREPRNGENQDPKPLKYDTVSILSTFRKDRQYVHERNIAAGNPKPETEGFWAGVVQVVRLVDDVRNDEEMDYYGDRFTSTRFYR